MSTTIDQRVVEMRFDNRHFEKNVQGTMSTLDKLKQKLNLSGAAKGLDNINTSANKVNMNGLSNSISTVQARFSALEVIGVTALANITNSAINAGKQMLSALTIAPVKDGFQEYEMMMNTIQTTMAATGMSAKEVEKELKKLDEYADKTVYSTADMMNNLPKFTNAGVKLETATKAMIGIANATALAGGDASKASIAFYNLGQAIGTGYLTRMDYNSINNAGIATMQWKQEMVDAAIAAGTLVKVGEDQYKAGKKTMTLQQLFIDGLQEQWATTDVMLKVFGDYGDETTKIGKASYAAAQDIKTFTMMMDSLKATAGTGWKDTWQIIFGDLDEAKELWTGLTNFISNIIGKMTKYRNDILESALGRSFKGLLDGISNSVNSVKEVAKTIKDYQKVVNEIISGKWGNTEKRWKALTEAGYDWKHAQNLVNEKLGNSLRRATDYKETQDELVKTQEKNIEVNADYIKSLLKMSDAQLLAEGLTQDQIDGLRELERVCKKTGISLETFLEHIDEIDGRWILIEAFKNLGKMLSGFAKTVLEAWNAIFNPNMGRDDIIQKRADGVFNLIAVFHKLTAAIPKLYDEEGKLTETGDKLVRTFKGIFAIVDLIATVAGGGFKLAFKILKKVLSLFNIDILEFTARIGDALVALRDWIKENNILGKAIEKIAGYIKIAVTAIKEWIENNETISKGIEKITSSLSKFSKGIQKWFEGLKETDNVPKYILEGLVNGLRAGVGLIGDAMITIGKAILEAIKSVLGIHSPSTEFFEIGQNIIQGLINGIKAGLSLVWNALKTVGETCLKVLSKIDFGKVLAVAIGVGMLVTVKKLLNVIDDIISPIAGLGDMFEGIGDGFRSWGRGKMIESVAKSVAILAGSLLLLCLVPKDRLLGVVAAMGALAVIIGVLGFAATKVGDLGDTSKIVLSFLGIAGALFLMASVFKKLASIESDKMGTVIEGFLSMILGLTLLISAIGYFIDGADMKDISKVGTMCLGIGAAMLLTAYAMKTISKLSGSDIGKGLGVILGLTLLYAALIVLSKKAGEHGDKAGKMISKIAFALLITIGVIKLASMLKGETVAKGIGVITLIGIFFAGLIAVSKLAGQHGAKAGWMLLQISVALAVMVGVIKLMAGLSMSEIMKAMPVLSAFGTFLAILIAVSYFAGENAIKAGTMLLMVSGALLILTGVLFLISKMDAAGVYKALGVITVLEVLFIGLIYVTKYAQDCMKTLIVIGVVIALLIGAVIGLSFLDPNRLATAAAAIAIIMGAFALLLFSTKAMSTVGPKALLGVVGLLAIVGMLYIVLDVLTKMDGLQNAVTNVMALGAFMTVMSIVLLLTAAVGAIYLATMGAGALGIVGLALLLLLLYDVVDNVAKMGDISNVITNLSALQAFMLAMTKILVITAVVGPLASMGVSAMWSLTGLMVVIGALAIAVGALMEKYPFLQSFLDKGLPVLIQIAGGIGAMIGAFVGGVIGMISTALPIIAINLSLFMALIQPFLEGASKVDKKVMDGVSTLAKVILMLTGVALLKGITDILTLGGSSFARLGTELSNFINNAEDFITKTSSLDPNVMSGVKMLSEAILVLTEAGLIKGISKMFGGGSSLKTFGEEVKYLGEGVTNFLSSLGDIKPAQVDVAKNAAEIIKVLAKAASEIPNSGGLLGALVGENDMSTFASEMPLLASGISEFIQTMSENKITSDSVKVADTAAKIIKTLASAAAEIPNSGGLLAGLVGDNKFGEWAKELPNVGKGIAGFVNAMKEGEVSSDSVNTAKTAAEVVKTLASAASEIPNMGGALAAFVGDNDLSTFATGLPDVGEGIAGFVNKLGNFDEKQLSTINAATEAIKVIANMTSEYDAGGMFSAGDSNDFESFGKGLETLAKKIKSFTDKMAKISVESIDSAREKIDKLIDLLTTLGSLQLESLSTFADTLKTVADKSVKKFVETFSSKDSVKDVTSAVETMAKKGVEGASKNLETSAATVGLNLVKGFAKGISDNEKLATDAGSSLGKAALAAAMEALDEHSPSREAMKVGNYFGQGLVIGIEDYESKTYNAGFNIADRAKAGLSKAISKISSLISSDMDTQPTIRPVLDLSDVESGASYLNSMFSDGPSIGIMSNLRAINSGMNSRNQNGVNDDVVSAINKLGRVLGNTGGDTYNINGVSVNDDSGVREAVQTIIRAATQERRI